MQIMVMSYEKQEVQIVIFMSIQSTNGISYLNAKYS
jgi:hypothetical protein